MREARERRLVSSGQRHVTTERQASSSLTIHAQNKQSTRRGTKSPRNMPEHPAACERAPAGLRMHTGRLANAAHLRGDPLRPHVLGPAGHKGLHEEHRPLLVQRVQVQRRHTPFFSATEQAERGRGAARGNASTQTREPWSLGCDCRRQGSRRTRARRRARRRQVDRTGRQTQPNRPREGQTQRVFPSRVFLNVVIRGLEPWWWVQTQKTSRANSPAVDFMPGSRLTACPGATAVAPCRGHLPTHR